MHSIFDNGPFAPCPHPFNMAGHVLGLAAQFGRKTALSVLHENHIEHWTYAEISQAVRGIATGLKTAGLRAGDRVLLRLSNTPDTPLAYLGAIAADIIPVPTSAQLTASETARIIAQLDPAMILHDQDVPCPDHPNICGVADLRQMMKLPPADFTNGDPNRPAYYVYTSGTSGQPRGVVHGHRSIWARRMMHDGWYDLTSADRVLHAGAFNWTYTMGTGLMDPWSVGATALIPAPGTAPSDLPALLRKHNASIFAAAPGVYRKLLQDQDNIDLPDLRHGLSAGEKLAPSIRAAWEAATGRQVHEAFGMSECSTFLSASPKTPATGTATGLPQQGRKIAILDDYGRIVARETPGTLAVHRSDPGLMIGYLNAAEDTNDRFVGEWFLTGDHAVMHTDDQVTYLGRGDDMMNAGGYRVSPLEVEAALSDAPGLDAVAVTDIEVKPGVRVIMAFYTGPSPVDVETLIEYATNRLAAYKSPRDYIHVTELPAGPNGKLIRKNLQSLWRGHMIKLDILSDPICPWCFIGKTHLDKALAARPNHPFTIEWHPFQLNPDMPADGMDRRAYLEGKFGGKEAAIKAYAPVVEHAEKAGINIDFEGMKRTPNTIDAHRLIHWAGIEKKQTEAVDALFKAYFTDARDIGDHDVLADVADSIGMDASVILRLLATDSDVEDIAKRDAHSREMGVSSVPTFIVAQQHAVPGAQQPELWEQVIDELMEQVKEA